MPASATHPHGLVIVGGRLGRTESSVEHRSECVAAHVAPSPPGPSVDCLAPSPYRPPNARAHRWADSGAGADEEDASARTSTDTNAVVEGHFSYYALDAYTGDIVWKHEEGDFLNTRQGPREQVRLAAPPCRPTPC